MGETDTFKFPRRWWLSSGAVRRLTPEERDFGVTLMCFMAEGNPPGTLTDQNGKPLSRRQVLDMTQMPEERALKMLNNLVDAGVIIREAGTRLLFNPQMRGEAVLSEVRRQAGQQGGLAVVVNKESDGYVYAIRRSSDGWVKVGVTSDPRRRLAELRYHSNEEIEMLGVKETDNVRAAAVDIQSRYRNQPHEGEWFDLRGEELTEFITLFDTPLPSKNYKHGKQQKQLSEHIPEDWKPSEDEMVRLITLSDVLWPSLTHAERAAKVNTILCEFIVYWTELKVIDTQTGSHKGKKRDWYATFRRRLQDVSFNERRTATYARMRVDSSGKVGTSQNGASPPTVCTMCEAAKNDNSLPPCQFHERR